MATTRMVFNLVATGDADRMFDKFTRSVELSNAAIAKNNIAAKTSTKALDDNGKAIDRHNSSLTRLSGTLKTTSNDFHGLAVAVSLLAPAVAPIAGVVTAGVIGLGGVLASTGAALGVFGLTAKAQFTALSAGYKQIQTLKEQAALAPAGSKQQAADYAKLALEQQKYAATFGPAAAGMNHLQDAWTSWKKATSGPTLSILAQGLNLVAKALPQLRPLFDTGAAAANRFLGAVQGWVAGGGLGRAVALLNDLAKQVFPYVEAAMRNLASIAGMLAPLFFDLGVKVAAGMAHVTGAMAAWAGNQGVDAMNSFMAYITANGPKVWQTLKDLAGAAVTIARDLAPLAPVSLAVAGALAKLISAASPGEVQAMAVAFVAYKAGLGGIVASGIWGIAKAVGAWAAAQWGLDAAMWANPIGLVVIAIAALGAAFYIAWQKSAGFRDFIKSLGTLVLGMGIQVVQGMKTVTDAVLGFMATTLNATAHVASALGQNWLADKLSAAANAITGFKRNSDNAFNGMISTMKGWQNELNTDKATVASVSASVINNFNRQGDSAKNAKGALDKYTDAVRFNGVTSNAAQQARFTLIADLVNAGVKASTANKDVSNYTNAISKNGLYSDQARQARIRLINDILSASGNARQGKKDTDNLTRAVQNHGLTSDAYRSARTKLINDLIASGVKASDAAKLVDGLGQSVKNLPGQKNVNVNVSGKGAWSIAQGSLQQKLVGYAAGGRVTAGTGPTADDVLVRVSRDETIVSAAHSARLAPFFAAIGVPGYAAGGAVGGNALKGQPMWVARSYDATVAFGINALTKAMTDAINAAVSAAKAQAASYGGVAGPGGGAPTANQALAHSLYQALLTPASWAAWNYVEMREAGWNQYARNPSSGAYGIPQALPESKLPFAGTRAGGSNPKAQIGWMWNYMSGRYGGPIGAAAHERAYNWYKRGSWDVPLTGPAVVHRGEMILPAELAAAVRSALSDGSGVQPDRIERLLKQLIAVSAAQGRQFAEALDGAARRARAY